MRLGQGAREERRTARYQGRNNVSQRSWSWSPLSKQREGTGSACLARRARALSANFAHLAIQHLIADDQTSSRFNILALT